MILTLTFNPALDVCTATAHVEPTHKLRCEPPQFHAGGGGINVARVAHRLGTSVQALFPAGGSTGEQLCRLLSAEGVPFESVPIAEESRQSFSVWDRQAGQDFRFVLPGPALSAAELQHLLDRVQALAPRDGFLVLSGGLARGVADEVPVQVVRAARAAGARCVLDSSGAGLRSALAEGVALVKPSLRELQQLTGLPLATEADQRVAAAQLVQAGQTEAVALSLGEAGALLVTAQGAWRAPALPVTVATTIGAGDSLVAGMVVAMARGLDTEDALRWGMASSAAALLAPGASLAQPADVERLLPQVQVTRLD